MWDVAIMREPFTNTEETNHAMGVSAERSRTSLFPNLSYTWGVCQRRSLCSISFSFRCHACPCTCPEQWQLINIIAMDWCTYNSSILSITFSEALTGNQNWARGQRQLHGRSLVKHSFLLRKSMFWEVQKWDWLEYQEYPINPANGSRELPLLQHCSSMWVEMP